ncbi:046R [Invertebrate iridescent virus 6]|uniref:046R n=1 Tax=Invertebrate iridescent virus 6 TaxID=176652 RepID=Q91G53_IIV6|nr:046R [Invertebrate iridescent virus 6]AAK81979.1 046R [Invertebrate iridescent virus 6]QMS79550.1 hypothetical protein IIV6-T1_051 [Invertebrate iridescent virus 6]
MNGSNSKISLSHICPSLVLVYHIISFLRSSILEISLSTFFFLNPPMFIFRR